MNARTPAHPDATALWLVVEWVDDDPRYLPVAAFATREDATEEAARHPGAMILFRPAPPPSPLPPSAPKPPPGPDDDF